MDERARAEQREINACRNHSNITQVKNALKFVCLAGAVSEVIRKETLDLISSRSDSNRWGQEAVQRFLILLYPSQQLSYRGLYMVHPLTGEITKLIGRGPKQIDPVLVKDYYKFETSARTFKCIQSNTLTGTTDAITIATPKIARH
jgi:hypothetical protein